MNRFYLRLAVAWLASVCVSCTSAPVRYYTLTTMPDETLAVLKTPVAIDVRVVHTAPQLKRAELMIRTGPTEVTILDNERWASPVSDEIKDALRLELRRRLSSVTGWRPAFAKVWLDVDVQRLETELGRSALLEASWSATTSGAVPQSTGAWAITCTFHAVEKITTGYAGMVEGYQREIAGLAEAIAGVLTSSANGVDASCH